MLLVSKFHSSHLLDFSEDLFFLYLLPPIIFNAGYALFTIINKKNKKKLLKRNLSTFGGKYFNGSVGIRLRGISH